MLIRIVSSSNARMAVFVAIFCLQPPDEAGAIICQPVDLLQPFDKACHQRIVEWRSHVRNIRLRDVVLLSHGVRTVVGDFSALLSPGSRPAERRRRLILLCRN